MSLFVGIFYEIAVSLWHFLFAAWLGVLFRSPAFLAYETGAGQISLWLPLCLLGALAWLFSGRRDMAGKDAFRFASVPAVAGLLAVVTLSEQTVLAIADDTLDMWTILSVVLMMSVQIFHINRQYETEKELARVKEEQAGLLERDYNALNQAYAVNARLFHDFHNHIGVLYRLLSQRKTEEALLYLNELQTPVREMADTMRTGDEILDYLINSKAATARAEGIDLQAQVEFPRNTGVKSADLCAILGNLLDNALEAAGKVTEEKERYVRLTIRRINQMLVIKVENPFADAPVAKDGGLITTKEDKRLHGWGLKSVRAAAEKYSGCVRTAYADGIFQAVVTLSYQGVTEKQL